LHFLYSACSKIIQYHIDQDVADGVSIEYFPIVWHILEDFIRHSNSPCLKTLCNRIV
jgi:hypothetical protein